MSSDDQPKRKASDAPVSPPPIKRKVQSGTTSEYALRALISPSFYSYSTADTMNSPLT